MTTRIIWPRIAYVYLILALVIFNLTCLVVGCDTATAAEKLPVPVATIIGECANCSVDDMIAIGNVIRNRASIRGQSFDEVCLAKWQFSFWNDRRRAEKFLRDNRGVVDRAWGAWQASAGEDLTGGSDHYFADYIKQPKWASSMAFKARVGKHLFYAS